MRMPRLLPLVAVAAGGVLAINAIENGPGIVGAARSFAEGVAPPAKAASPLPAGASAAAPPAAGQVVAAKPAPVCAESPTELAKEAGLSPAELQVIQSLGARRGELDQREQGLSTELALIQAAEAKVDAKIATMNGLKADMQKLVGQLDDKQQAEVDRLVKVYADMKPQAAAARFSLLTDEVRLPIAAAMKEQKLSAIVANMAPADAKHLTEALAARYVAQANAARAAINPPAAQPAAATAPNQAPAATPATQAAASPAGAQPASTADAAPARPKPAVHRKPKVARPPAEKVAAAAPAAKPPAKTASAKPPEPVWPPKPASGAAAAAKPGAATPAVKSAAATSAPAAKPPATPPAAKSASATPAPPAKTG